MREHPLQFKVATEDWEFEQVHRLNYKTFVEEIPQHQVSGSARLVDKFHDENTYLVCLCGNQVVGMVAARGRRPFSLDQKLADLDSYLPPGYRACEIRLLSVEKEYRNGQVFRGLAALMWQFGTEHGYDLGVISGTTRQTRLYRHLGFIPFGPQVGKGDAMFQPMYLTLENFKKAADVILRKPLRPYRPINFLPGPVTIPPHVRKAFERTPESHRSDFFISDFQQTRGRLCQLTRACNVQVLLGSGTLSNDVVAAQLTLEKRPGVILSNGEFGDRLIDHGKRWGLTFDTLKFPWGQALDLDVIQEFLTRNPAVGWLWCVHSETSTGMINPLPALLNMGAKRGVKICADCISSIGLVPINLERIYLASGASGKGLASYPGLSMVYYNHTVASSHSLPRYLDLGWYAENKGIAFTHSSNLVHALDAAVKEQDWEKKYADVAEVSVRLRQRLRELGFRMITDTANAMPGVVTMALRADQSSVEYGQRLQKAGYLLSYNSDYLRKRNWIQICLMGEYSKDKIEALLTWLTKNPLESSQALANHAPLAAVAG